jgi:hypothetical protein
MAAQYHVGQVLPPHHVDDIGDVGLHVDPNAQEMRTLAESCQRRRENAVAGVAKPVGDPPPTPAAVPSAVDEDEGIGYGNLRNRASI